MSKSFALLSQEQQDRTAAIRAAVGKLTPEDREQFTDHLQEAIYHLASCWDALFQCERLLSDTGEIEIETEHISGVAGETGASSEAYKLTLDEILDRMEVL